jgi:hypothetical protein
MSKTLPTTIWFHFLKTRDIIGLTHAYALLTPTDKLDFQDPNNQLEAWSFMMDTYEAWRFISVDRTTEISPMERDSYMIQAANQLVELIGSPFSHATIPTYRSMERAEREWKGSSIPALLRHQLRQPTPDHALGEQLKSEVRDAAWRRPDGLLDASLYDSIGYWMMNRGVHIGFLSHVYSALLNRPDFQRDIQTVYQQTGVSPLARVVRESKGAPLLIERLLSLGYSSNELVACEKAAFHNPFAPFPQRSLFSFVSTPRAAELLLESGIDFSYYRDDLSTLRPILRVMQNAKHNATPDTEREVAKRMSDMISRYTPHVADASLDSLFEQFISEPLQPMKAWFKANEHLLFAEKTDVSHPLKPRTLAEYTLYEKQFRTAPKAKPFNGLLVLAKHYPNEFSTRLSTGDTVLERILMQITTAEGKENPTKFAKTGFPQAIEALQSTPAWGQLFHPIWYQKTNDLSTPLSPQEQEDAMTPLLNWLTRWSRSVSNKNPETRDNWFLRCLYNLNAYHAHHSSMSDPSHSKQHPLTSSLVFSNAALESTYQGQSVEHHLCALALDGALSDHFHIQQNPFSYVISKVSVDMCRALLESDTTTLKEKEQIQRLIDQTLPSGFLPLVKPMTAYSNEEKLAVLFLMLSRTSGYSGFPYSQVPGLFGRVASPDQVAVGVALIRAFFDSGLQLSDSARTLLTSKVSSQHPPEVCTLLEQQLLRTQHAVSPTTIKSKRTL